MWIWNDFDFLFVWKEKKQTDKRNFRKKDRFESKLIMANIVFKVLNKKNKKGHGATIEII